MARNARGRAANPRPQKGLEAVHTGGSATVRDGKTRTEAPVEAESPSQGASAAVAAAVYLVQLCVFARTAHQSVPGGDSGELIAVSHVGGVPHPPGYPLYAIIVGFITRTFSFGSVAFRANLFSAVCAAAAGTILHSTVVMMTGVLGAGVFAVAIFSFARLQWLYATTGEVFALNNLLVAALMHETCRFARQPSLGTACMGAAIGGLALTNQHTAVLFVVVVAPWALLKAGATGLLNPTAGGLILLCGAVGLAPYAYVPWSATQNTAALTWGDQRTVRGFVSHLLRQEYGTFDLAKGGRESVSFVKAVELHMRSLADETMWLCPVLFVVGCLAPARNSATREVQRVLVACLLLYMGFFNWRANLDLSNRLLAGVQERFWMQPNMIFAFFAGLGFAQLTSGLKAFVGKSRAEGGAIAVAIAILALQVGANFESRDESGNFAVRDFGRALLEGLPKDSILLTHGDLPGNAVRYLQACERVRLDVHAIDLEMMTFEWYLSMTGWAFKGVKFPGRIKRYSFGAQYFDMKKFFDANIKDRDIFVYENLNADDTSWMDGYEVWRHGIARAIKPKGSHLNATAWLATALHATPNYTVPDPVKYDERTWERVVHDITLSSGVELALFFERRASAAASAEERLELYSASAAVYESLFSRRVFDGHREVFWHKNAGLAYYNMVQLRRTKDPALTAALQRHWSAYLAAGPDDPQTPDIKRILKDVK